MKNNFNEDMSLSDKIKKTHETFVERVGLPKWMKIDCPFCKKEMKWSDIRSIKFCLNARNAGDVAVEFACSSCGIGDTMYWRKEFHHILHIADIVLGAKIPQGVPLIEEDMYKAMYNNIVDELVKNETKEKSKKTKKIKKVKKEKV